MTIAMRVRTALALGLRNVARALVYRGLIRAGLHPAQRLSLRAPKGPFFREPAHISSLPPRTEWRSEMFAFGHQRVPVGNAPPDWLADVIDGATVKGAHHEWWTIPDFGSSDIKTVWELSRFDWVIAFAQAAASGETSALIRLNVWLEDWLAVNKPGFGPNWKCGQEASIRILHLAAAALILDQIDRPETGLVSLLRLHLQRIAPTLSYAISQDNNHGTSEAAALFVGGAWLARLGEPDGARFAQLGRRTLEERIARLVSNGGTFSQYSVTYHRMMLDTLSFAELWRRHIEAPAFSDRLVARLARAAQWLQMLTDAGNGDAPNVGTNDGTRILRLSDEPFRDFRGSVQLATALFARRRAYVDPIPGDDALAWLRVALPDDVIAQPDHLIDDEGGFAAVRVGSAMAMLRFPRFRFRPGQADVLHIDYWCGGRNLMRDAGTYGYNSGDEVLNAFAGVAGHNTAQFDDHDQMPRLSRFLFGDWIAPGIFDWTMDGENLQLRADYRDRWGCRHARTLHLLSNGRLEVSDRLDGFSKSAILRWHLPPGEARIDGNRLFANGMILNIFATSSVILRIAQGWESRHYLHKARVPVLEIIASSPLEIRTSIIPTP